jgi:hypothetical protein
MAKIQAEKVLGAKKTAKRRVPFVVKGIEARLIAVTGDFTGWSAEGIRLDRGGNGEWQGTLQLDPGDHEYRLLVDGAWRDHAEAGRRVPNSFGSENCVLTVV